MCEKAPLVFQNPLENKRKLGSFFSGRPAVLPNPGSGRSSIAVSRFCLRVIAQCADESANHSGVAYRLPFSRDSPVRHKL